MTDFPISDEAVEAVAKTLIHELTENEYRDMAENGSPTLDSARLEAHVAIAAFVEAEGLRVERTTKRFKTHIDAPDEDRIRLVTDWRRDDTDHD